MCEFHKGREERQRGRERRKLTNPILSQSLSRQHQHRATKHVVLGAGSPSETLGTHHKLVLAVVGQTHFFVTALGKTLGHVAKRRILTIGMQRQSLTRPAIAMILATKQNLLNLSAPIGKLRRVRHGENFRQLIVEKVTKMVRIPARKREIWHWHIPVVVTV